MSYTPVLPLRKVPWPRGDQEQRSCPVCKMPWTPWAGSRLFCHARCLFSELDRQLMRSDIRTDKEIAKELGVSRAVIRGIRRVRYR